MQPPQPPPGSPPPGPAHISHQLDRVIAKLRSTPRHAATSLSLAPSEVEGFVTAALSHPAGRADPTLLGDLLSLAVVPGVWPNAAQDGLRDAAGAAAKSGVCGYVWKVDELAYKCRTCERDPTCVICVPCFRRGNHEGHDYAMVRTGGGCCDCGDVQAWRREGFCSEHSGACAESADPGAALPPDLRTRLHVTVTAVARKSLFVLAQLHCLVFPSHTERRAAVNRVKALLGWLKAVVSCGDAIRRVVSEVLIDGTAQGVKQLLQASVFDRTLSLSDKQMDAASWLDLVLMMDGVDRLPIIASQALHELYFQLINDLVFKRQFLKSLVANYERYVHAKVVWRYKHPTMPLSESDIRANPVDILENFTVQLFTVPALIPVMIEKGGLLDVLLGVLLNLFEVTSSPVRAYFPDIPFQKTAFAANYPAVVPLVRRAQAGSSVSRSTAGASSSSPPSLSSSPPASSSSPPASSSSSPQQQQAPVNITQLLTSLKDGCLGVPAITAQVLSTLIADRREREAISVPQLVEDDVEVDASEEEEQQNDTVMTPIDAEDAEDMQAEDIAILQGVDLDGEQLILVGPDADDDEQALDWLHDEMEEIVPVTAEETQEVNFGEIVFSTDSRRHSQELKNQLMLKVFEDGLSFVPAKHTMVSTQDVPKTHFRSCVASARKQNKAAIKGSGLVMHPLRVDLQRKQHVFLDAIWKVMKDLVFVIGHESVAFHLVHERKDLFRLLLRMLSMTQGMNPVSRRFGDHVPGENETWTKTYTAEIEFYRLIDPIVAAFSTVDTSQFDEEEISVSKTAEELRESRRDAIGIVLKCLHEWLSREEALEQLSTYKGEEFTVSHSVSSHLPLHRLLGLLIHHVLRVDGGTVASLLLQGGHGASTDEARRILLHPLRLQVFFAQVRSGMWKKNGGSVSSQSLFYSSMLCSEWFVDLDLFIQQCCAVVLGPEIFVDEVHKVFCVGDFGAVADLAFGKAEVGQVNFASNITGDKKRDSAAKIAEKISERVAQLAEKEGSKSLHGLLPFAPMHLAETGRVTKLHNLSMGNDIEELAKFSQALLEELLVYLIRISSERARCGQSGETLLRLRVVHQLCPRDKLYSHIIRTCSYRTYCDLNKSKDVEGDEGEDANQSVLEAILASIADFVRPKGMEQGRYRIRDALWKEFDPFSPHLIKRERCSAEVRRAAVCKRLRKKVQAIPEERICDRDLYEQFRGLVDIPLYVCSSGPQAVASVALQKLTPRDGIAFSVEGLLPAALHLLCMAVEFGHAFTPSETVLRSVALSQDPNKFAESSLGALCKIATQYHSLFPDLEAEHGPVLERILHASFDLGDERVNNSLVEGARYALQSRIRSEGAASGAAGKASKTPEELRREKLLKKKKEQQAAALAQMKMAQSFFQKHISGDGDDDDDEEDEFEHDDVEMTDPGSSEEAFESVVFRDSDCALCHGSEQSQGTSGLMCLIGFRQRCSIPNQVKDLCEHGKATVAVGNASEADGDEQIDATAHAPGTPTKCSSDGPAWLQGAATAKENVHLSFCGHAVHFACFEAHFSTLLHSRDNNRIYVGFNIVNLDRDEFLCPVCRRLSNMMLPTLDSMKRRLGLPSGPRKRLNTFVPQRISGATDTYVPWVSSRDTEVAALAQDATAVAEKTAEAEGSTTSGNTGSANGASATSARTVGSQGLTPKWVHGLTSALKRFSLFGMASGVVAGSTGNGGSEDEAQARRISDESNVFGTHSKLAMSIASTAACLEIATRGVAWGESLLQHARRSTRLMFSEAREHVWVEAEQRARDLSHVWREVRARKGLGGVDPFAVLCYMTILWPASLTRGELRRLVRLALETMGETSGSRGAEDATRRQLDEMLFLRQATALVATLFEEQAEGVVPPLAVYGEDVCDGGAARGEADALRAYLELPRAAGGGGGPVASVRNARFMPVRVGLIALPGKLQTLLEQTDRAVCTKCGLRNAESVLCLVTGAVLCALERDCRGGGMRLHAGERGGGVGVFLNLRRTNVDIVRGQRVAKWGSPYLDAHGEEDQTLMRGRPLYLSRERYEELGKLWLLAAFDQDPHILNKTQLGSARMTRL